jgi:conjugal transfer ATP-binding protein TraC
MRFPFFPRRRSAAPSPSLPPDAGRLGGDTRRLALGRRGVADLIAPAAVEVGRDWLRLDGGYARGLYLSALPREVGDGWLAPLVGFEEPLDLAQHIAPLDTARMIRDLGNRLNAFEASRRAAERLGQLRDAGRSMAMEDVAELQEQLTRGEEKLFSVGHYLLLRAPSVRQLDDLTGRLEGVLGGRLQAASRVALYEQALAFRACLPEGQDRLGHAQTLTSSALAASFPFDAGTLSMPTGILYGLSRQSLLIFDPFDRGLTNANSVVIAPSGAGKSFFVKLLALRNLEEGIEFFVIDPDDEYRRLCEAVGGQYVRLALASAQAINPFDLPLPAEDEPEGEPRDPLAEQVDALLALLELMLADPGKELLAEERATLDRALYDTYAGAGIVPGDPGSWAEPPPLMGDLAAQLGQMAGDVAASLRLRLRRYVDGSLAGLVNRRTSVDLDGRLVVFSIQRLDRRLQPLAIQIIASYVWGRIRRSKKARRLVVDEGWKLLQHPAGGDFLQAMYRRARKYELGLDLIVHRAEDLRNSEHGDAILANAAVKVVLKQNETTIGAVAALFDLTPFEERHLLGAEKGEGLFFARGARVPLRVVASEEEHALATSDPREVAAIEAAAREAGRADAATRSDFAAPADGDPSQGTPRAEAAHANGQGATVAHRPATSVGYRPRGGGR